MWNVPTKERLNKIPKLYETEKIPLDKKLIYLHFFIGGSDWYIAEYDGENILFGYSILNGDTECAEWGYIYFSELRDLKIGMIEVDCELEEYWDARQFDEIGRIKSM